MRKKKYLIIAFEISPFLTASGTFGDKSGVYRYMWRMLKSLTHLRQKKIKIVLFSFNESLIKSAINPDILELVDNDTVILIDKYQLAHPVKTNLLIRVLQKITGLKPNFILKIINRILFIKPVLEYVSSQIRDKAYLNFLKEKFTGYRVQVIYHSQTGFNKIKGLKNVITTYDLTPITMPEFHRSENVTLLSRNLKFAQSTCDGVICISKSTENDLIRYSNIFKNKKRMIGYPGLDPIFKSSFALRSRKAVMDELNTILQI